MYKTVNFYVMLSHQYAEIGWCCWTDEEKYCADIVVSYVIRVSMQCITVENIMNRTFEW